MKKVCESVKLYFMIYFLVVFHNAKMRTISYIRKRRHKNVHCVQGVNLSKFINIINLRNCETDLLAPRMKTSNGQKAFSFRGAKLWNESKHEVKLAPSLSTFKCRLKSKKLLIFHLF